MENKNYHEDLSHIRSMMEKSSRFISLSGLSGVFAGLTALVGAAYVFWLFKKNRINYFDGKEIVFTKELIQQVFFTGIIVLIVAIFCGYFFTAKKSKKAGLKIWDKTTKRLLVNFAIPLFAGTLYCLALLYHGLFIFILPTTLIFYGLALVNASKYTLTDVQYLGYMEIGLGLISLFFLGWGFLFWIIGFGVLHIVYGLVMHKKYQ